MTLSEAIKQLQELEAQGKGDYRVVIFGLDEDDPASYDISLIEKEANGFILYGDSICLSTFKGVSCLG